MKELTRVLRPYMDEPTLQRLGQFLDEQYGGDRPYHNWQHIHHLLELFQQYQSQLNDPDAVVLSIYFHDVIYDPLHSDNELQSAERAQEWLVQSTFPAESTRKVYEFILATKNHENLSGDTDLDYFLDFDLSILGAQPAAYQVYATQIRKEYQQIPDGIYREGRIHLLTHGLALPAIFKTEDFKELYEKQARENMENERFALS